MNTDQLRKHYLPARLSIIFMAEATPDDPERFFYNAAVTSHDWLYLGLMKVLYDDATDKPDSYLREHKAEYLARFKNDGYYLMDAVDGNLPKPSKTPKSQRMNMIKNNTGRKIHETKELVAKLGDERTKVILIKVTVYEALFDAFQAAGIPVIQKQSIPFPLYPKYKKEFHQKLTALLRSL